MGGERLVLAPSRLPSRRTMLMRVRCHMRRAEMMDEMMSRPLRACFLSFPFALPPLVCLLASACSPARRAWDVRADY